MSFAIGRFEALFLYLEMQEQIGQTQGAGEYCGGVHSRNLYTGNAEIPSIIGTAQWISVPSRFPIVGNLERLPFHEGVPQFS